MSLNKFGCIDQLRQLLTVISDGDLISKGDRDHLFKNGLCDRIHGYSFITGRGLNILKSLNILK